MNKFKRFITPVTVVFMALCMPLLVHASDNSVTIIPAEGNVQCADYSLNNVIESMEADGPNTLSGDDFDGDGVDESGNYTITDLTTLSFSDTSVPIDYTVIKSRRNVSVAFYLSGGVTFDGNLTVLNADGVALEITAFSLCYGLSNPTAPVNQAPSLDLIGDKEVTDGDDLMFPVTATDDGLPGDALTITHSTLPTGASFTDNGDGSGDFEWLGATPAGSTNVTFTVSDGALIDSETITITVNEIPPEPLATPTCELLTTLDETGIVCPAPVIDEVTGEVTNSSVVCQWELGEDFYGFADGSDICCICNGDALVKCDPDLPAGSPPNAAGEYSCNLTNAAKAELDLPPAEATTIIEFNNDPYYCYTSGGRRICYCYGSLCPTR